VLHLEPTMVAMGQYVMGSQLIPACCTTIVKDMITAGQQNAQILCSMIQKRIPTSLKNRVFLKNIAKKGK